MISQRFYTAWVRTGMWKKGLKGLWRNAPVRANDVTGVRWE